MQYKTKPKYGRTVMGENLSCKVLKYFINILIKDYWMEILSE